ncbi:1-acyl-sn-glycerol-3-phosphate acyltransferase [Flavipsychrobacter stenotrophus]|uniref:1-acyl-sn-glycerol-3-phosphate acyltransferase n=1 Tax=Flavipsychrobacter stenotrophus TaxID=2077091 RepID=A0A2S7SUJ9_9BACT|nr:lysophospholipid acyltransferase family protein [Flavipsychrobacter stenotrophus]PQJ10563.1 1-acyl-sn-glycerol-3-phosphate acyltransferase [Flavipsychrobacter stenotrophus]
MLRKILQPFYTLYVIVTFVISILIALPLIAIVSLADNMKGRKIIHMLIRMWSIVWLWLIGMPVKVKGMIPEGRHIIVANHISYMDTLIIFPAISSYFRPLGKKEMSKVPVIGFIYKQVVILVDRSNAVSRAVSMRLMWRVLRKEGNIVIFPEGTFNETEDTLKSFYDGAFRLALNTQTDILPLILPDTVDRWHFSAWWKIWPGKNRAVFLKPVKVAGMRQDQVAELKQEVFSKMEAELVKYKQAK